MGDTPKFSGTVHFVIKRNLDITYKETAFPEIKKLIDGVMDDPSIIGASEDEVLDSYWIDGEPYPEHWFKEENTDEN